MHIGERASVPRIPHPVNSRHATCLLMSAHTDHRGFNIVPLKSPKSPKTLKTAPMMLLTRLGFGVWGGSAGGVPQVGARAAPEGALPAHTRGCLLYTSDAADDTPCVDL
eukprot:8208079-Pyramimonas_sp.AAC.2